MEEHSKDDVHIGDLTLRFRVTEPGATVFEFVVPPHARVPAPHSHAEADEMLYGLEGVLTVTIDGERCELSPGEVAFIRRAQVHHHENRHEGISRTLVAITPGTIGRDYFEAIAKVVAGPGPPDAGQVRTIMLRHGLVPA